MKDKENIQNTVKVCHVSTTFIYKAGSARRTFAILKALSKRNYRVTQVTGRDFVPSSDWDLSNIEFFHIPSLVKYINPHNDITALYKLYKLFNNLKPHIVHTHLAKAGILGRLAARWAKVPHIVTTVHGPTFSENINSVKRLIYRFLEHICGKFTDWFIFVGYELRDEYVKNRICPIEKTKIIQSGRPESDFALADKFTQEEIQLTRKKFSNNKNGFFIGYIGRLVPSKAQDMAIHALKIIRDKGIDGYLVFIGEGHLTEEKRYEALLRRLTEKLNIGRHVYFLGYQNDVLSYMKAMNVLVLTSKYEGLPNIAVEAGIVGRPLVAFKVCGISEVIQNEETGFIVKQGNVKAMAERLIFLARNPGIAEEMGYKAQRKVRYLYTTERMIEEKFRFYESILRKNN